MALIAGAICWGWGCKTDSARNYRPRFGYKQFKDSITRQPPDTSADNANLLDGGRFDPAKDSLQALLKELDSAWRQEYADTVPLPTSGIRNNKDSLLRNRQALSQNLSLLDSFLLHHNPAEKDTCRGKDCLLYAEVNKASQRLLLYMGGELVDSFRVSTGKKDYETPEMDTRPAGPLFQKYISKKFPGGNYRGLGNMPYAVFIRNGYAIHGTTLGNIRKLGSPASHGCIRLHPDNARVFYELVKLTGLAHTWVTVKDSIPR
ncbi:MAG: L,D-transpeptidase [Ferruginibacter sp.]